MPSGMTGFWMSRARQARAGGASGAGQTSSWYSSESMGQFGAVMAIAGVAQEAIGTYYEVTAMKGQLRARREQLLHESNMSAIAARDAELEAQAIVEAGEVDIGLRTLQHAQEKGTLIATQGGSGITIGVGNAAEQVRALDFARDVDVFNLGVNKVRAAGAARAQATNLRNRSNAAGVSAGNVARTAGSLRPGLAAGASLAGRAGGYVRRSARDRAVWAGSHNYED